MAIERISVLGVPVDVCEPKELEGKVLELLERKGSKQIIFLSIWDLLKARRKNEFSECVRNADLILPVSKSILSGAKFLKKTVPIRYNQFNAIVSLVSILERYHKSLYLLGGRKVALLTAEANARKTMPTLHIVGRFTGYYPKSVDEDVVVAIRKASPSLVLVSDGIKEKNLWSYRRREQFSDSIFLYYRDTIGIFSGRINRVKDKVFNKGHEIWGEIIKNPFKIFLIFPYMHYRTLLIWTRLFKKDR